MFLISESSDWYYCQFLLKVTDGAIIEVVALVENVFVDSLINFQACPHHLCDTGAP